jgi:APA family basic amino acid/polyamine antiporter
LAANHPVSGGTYEYGYRWLSPSLGFTAGWMFLCAKSASAATAALGCAGYLLNFRGSSESGWLIPLALAVVIGLTILVLVGVRRSIAVNVAIVSTTLVSLAVFVLGGLPTALANGTDNLIPFFQPLSPGRSRVGGTLEACALMFVAYTGYGRIATLAEEVRMPRRNIPLAIIFALGTSMALYLAVTWVSVASVGAQVLATAGVQRAAPLELVAERFDVPAVAWIVSIGAITAMVGVLLNLILGLSRVVLAIARRREFPIFLARVSHSTGTPYPAVIVVGAMISVLLLIGDLKTTWSFSAFTVLIYYAITNLAALRLNERERLYSRLFPWTGLISCLFLALWVEPYVWLTGLGLIAAGLVWHLIARSIHRTATPQV